MNRISAIFIILLLGCGINSFAQTSEIRWLSWEEAMQKMEEKPRKILVDVYTDDCPWCKRMDETFQQPHIVNYINEYFYPVKLNAQQKEDIVFRDKKYSFIKNGQRGYHELAVEILRGRLSFPSVVFMDEKTTVIQSLSGYKPAEDFEQIVSYFAQNHYKKTPWSTYQASFKSITD